MSILGENIKKYRKQKNLTQEDLAKALNVRKGAVSTWERGANTPSFEMLDALCDVLDVHMSKLVSDASSSPYSISDNADFLDSLPEVTDVRELVYDLLRLDKARFAHIFREIQYDLSTCEELGTTRNVDDYIVDIRIVPED